MARPRSAVIYEAGPVRVAARGKAFRIRWMEHGVERERKVGTLPDAIRTADTIAGRLALAGGSGVSGAAAYGALADAWVERYRTTWGAGHLANVEAILDGHVLPVVGRISCDRVTDTELDTVLRTMTAAGYSTDWRSQAVRTMRALGRWGVTRGVWTAATDPASTLRQPAPTVEGVDRTLIPSAAQVAALSVAVGELAPNPDQSLRRRWMVAAAVGCGLRFSEATALTPASVDLETRQVVVATAWVRQESGGPEIGPPKSRHSRRTVIIPVADVPLWREVLEATDDGGYLGTTQRGAVWRSSGWKQRVWDDAIAQVEGWPPRAGYHFLRHFAVISWLDRGLPIGDVSRLAGHHDAAFTMKRYVGPATDHLDQARDLL